jgi:methyltransferase-like protein
LTAAAPNTYDSLPYPSLPHHQSHPDRLATPAALLGLDPAPIERCRVLELGAAAGGNLIPLAVEFPEGRFVGVDFSEVQVRYGRSQIDSLGLTNCRLEKCDIRELGRDFGEFDYIIAHGIYSWITPDLRERLLEICAQNLAPQGVAYVSYNIYPGWGLRRCLRELMLYFSRGATTPAERARLARATLDGVCDTTALVLEETRLNALYGVQVKLEQARVSGYADASMYHEFLDSTNDPLFFHEFAAQAAAKGLQYLAEARSFIVIPPLEPPKVAAALAEHGKAGGLVAMEQYMDFLRNRGFRETLLCHAGARVDRTIAPERLLPLHAASNAQAKPPLADPRAPGAVMFAASKGRPVTATHPLAKAALLVLAEAFPRAVRVDRLIDLARERLGPGVTRQVDDARVVGTILLAGYVRGGVDFFTRPRAFATEIAARPVASRLARLLAEQHGLLTNLRHELVHAEEDRRRFIGALDGTRDRAALSAVVADLAASGLLPERGPAAVETALDRLLGGLLKDAFLVP